MKQHCSNAQKVVEYLKKHKVSKVIYSTEHDKMTSRAKKYLNGGNGPMVGIELKGGFAAGKKFMGHKNVLPCCKYW